MPTQSGFVRTRHTAFTLLEILIVVGIIALLAAFVVPSFMKTRQGAEISLARTAVETSGPIASALKMYYLHMNEYPKELKDLSEKPDSGNATQWQGPYIEDAGKLKDPWGEDYQYRYPSQHQFESSPDRSFATHADTYDLWSKGPDRQDGTADDISNWPPR